MRTRCVGGANYFIISLGAHAQRAVLVLGLLPRFLPLRAKREQNNDTYRFLAVTISFLKADFRKTVALKSYGVKTKRTR